jgi:two-component system response regulator (stage 0 sporulation protein F)
VGTILVIDDDHQVRAVFRTILERAGHHVLEARTGTEGLRLFHQSPVNLVITDVLMPDMDGLEVTQTVHREAPGIPVIALTGGTGERDFLEVAKLLGARRLLHKPVTKAELLHAVQEALQGGMGGEKMVSGTNHP